MKVYVKKWDYQSEIYVIITMIFLFVFSLYLFYDSINSYGLIHNINYFIEMFSSNGFALLFGISFFVLDVFVVCSIFKKPKEYVAKLIYKKDEEYLGNKITYMHFEIIGGDVSGYIPKVYRCYTVGDNEFKINQDYVIKIKEFNQKIKFVNYLKNNTSVENRKLNYLSLLIPFIMIEFIFGGILLFTIFYMFYSSEASYFGSMIGIVICSIFCIGAYKMFRQFNMYNCESRISNSTHRTNRKCCGNC